MNSTLTDLGLAGNAGIDIKIIEDVNALCEQNKAKKLEEEKENAKHRLVMKQVHKIGGFGDDPRNTIDQLNYKVLAEALVSVVTSAENTNSSFAIGL